MNPSPYDLQPEPLVVRGTRRVLSISGVVLLFCLYLAALPLLLAGAVGTDLYRRRGWIVVRTVALVGFYLSVQIFGIVGLSTQWLLSGVWRGGSHERLMRWTTWFGGLWCKALYDGASWIFNVNTEIEGDEQLEDGPFILFMRHVSVADTMIPNAHIMQPHRKPMRHALKSELLIDPCFDMAGHRWSNVFIKRDSGNPAKEVEILKRMMKNLGTDGVVIWPEGTRFTPEKRERVLAKIQKTNPGLYQDASALKNLLPPHRGGPLGLLEANEARADAVFCAHVGFEALQHVRSFVNGSMIGATVRIKYWRAPYADIPTDPEGRIKWLYHWWKVMDAWVGEQRG